MTYSFASIEELGDGVLRKLRRALGSYDVPVTAKVGRNNPPLVDIDGWPGLALAFSLMASDSPPEKSELAETLRFGSIG
jgi:hypothetical protein